MLVVHKPSWRDVGFLCGELWRWLARLTCALFVSSCSIIAGGLDAYRFVELDAGELDAQVEEPLDAGELLDAHVDAGELLDAHVDEPPDGFEGVLDAGDLLDAHVDEGPVDAGGLPCAAVDAFDVGATYGPEDRVRVGERVYECRAWPASDWCAADGYEPGRGPWWADAWAELGTCVRS